MYMTVYANNECEAIKVVIYSHLVSVPSMKTDLGREMRNDHPEPLSIYQVSNVLWAQMRDRQ